MRTYYSPSGNMDITEEPGKAPFAVAYEPNSDRMLAVNRQRQWDSFCAGLQRGLQRGAVVLVVGGLVALLAAAVGVV